MKAVQYIKHKTTLFFALLILITSCGKIPDHSKYIPQEASMVVCVNMKNVLQKAEKDWTKLIRDELLSNLGLDKKELTQTIRKNLKKSGIEFNNIFYFYTNVTDENVEGYTALSFQLKNESEFHYFLKELPKGKNYIESSDGISYVLLNQRTIVGWANKVAILVSLPETTTKESLKEALLKLRELPKKRSLNVGKDSTFRKLKYKDYDVGLWMDIPKFKAKIQENLKGSAIILSQIDLQDNFFTATSTFEEGIMNLKGQIHTFNLSANSLNTYRFLVKEGLSADLIQAMPSQEAMTGFAVGLDPEGFNKLLNDTGADLIFNSITSLHVIELFELLTGDVVAIIDQNPGEIDFTLGMEIAKEVDLDLLLSDYVEDEKLVKQENPNHYLLNLNEVNIHILRRDKFLFLTPNDKVKEAILDTLQGNLAEKITLKSQDCFMFYSNIEDSIRKAMPTFMLGAKSEDNFLRNTTTPFETMSITALPIENNVINFHSELYFKENEKNALLAVIKMLEQFANQNKKKNEN